MDLEKRLELISREPTEEIVKVDELRNILESNSRPRHYIGLEISGLMHLGSLVISGFKINDFIKANIDCNVFLADWHSYINNKLDQNWEFIKEVSNYYAEAFRLFCPGVTVILGSSLYHSNDEYWKNFITFSKQMTLSRTMRAITIMGRSERENLDFSQLLYPSMQSVDIKALDLDIVHAGMDQRKIHMLVREIFPKLQWKVPVAIHHHLLPGLTEPTKISNSGNESDDRISSKMSKSNPLGGILIHDDETTISRKILKAYCPPKIAVNNPVLEIIKYVIFHEYPNIEIERPSKYGGPIVYNNYSDLEKDYLNDNIHPLDLKKSTSKYINNIITPLRSHFKGKEILPSV
jgi:tyrosyl-tRNA synthetase